mgnify:CR=1 FL=1
MATITFSGLSGSGLDTSSWVDALVSVKQTTITSLQAQKEAQQKLLSVVNNIKSFFSSFQTCLQKITDSQFGIASIDLFMQNLANSSNTNILTATATTEAARQTYDVLVDQLATSTKATSGYTKSETKYATLDTTLGKLGAKAGTITVNNQSFTISENDTIKDLIDKFSKVGVVASFDSKKSRFTVGASINEINDGATGLKNVLGLQNTNITGAASGSIVYANKDTKFSDLGLTAGKININGIEHNVQKSGTNYTIQKAGGTKVNINTINDFLNILKTNFGAEATIDNQGNISIRGCVIGSVAGGSNLKDILNLADVQERTVMKSNALTWQKTNVADYSTALKDLGLTGSSYVFDIAGTKLSFGRNANLQFIKLSANGLGVDFSVDENGVITVDTNGKTVSGTLLDALGLVADKSGTTLTSNAHTVTYKATGSTKLSDLGIANTDTYIAYKSDGTAITGSINNVADLTVDEFVAQLKTKGLDASFDNNTQQIVINDGYITGAVANKFGMTKATETHQEAATVDTTLAKLGATGKQSLTINGGTAKEYEKTAKLSDVIKDITDAGGTVELKDGTMKVSGVTLTGTLAALLGFSATTQGTSVTSGALSVVTNSSSTSSSAVQETQNNQIALTTKLGNILGLTSGSKTLAVNGGTSVSYDVTSKTLNDVKTAVETAGGTFTINDDNTISVSGVTLSGTLVTALGLATVGTATSMTSNRAITVGGVENYATTANTLADFGATGDKTLSINGGTAKTYTKTTALSTVFADIATAGGTATIKDGVVTVSGVSLSGTAVDVLGLEATQSGTEVTSGNLTYTASTTSTSSSSLKPVSVSVATSGTQWRYLNSGTEQVVYVSDVSDFTTGKTYHVSTVDDMKKLAELTNAGANTAGVRFVLDNDIDMASVSNFTPISATEANAFGGTFDGQGYQIKNLKISNTSVDRLGLFGSVTGGIIKNLGVSSATVEGRQQTGILVGQANNMTVKNCWSSGSVSGNGSFIGGLVGNMNSSTVTGSYSTATVSGSAMGKGGLIGQVGFNGNVSNCYAVSSVTGGSLNGILIGSSSGGVVDNCYAVGSGTLLGGQPYWSSAGSVFTNCVYTGSGTGGESSGSHADTFTNCAKVTTSDLRNSSKMAQYGFTTDNGWFFESGNNPILMGTTGSNILYINGTKETFNETDILSTVAYQIKKAGGTMTINEDGSLDVTGVTLYGGLANKLGLTTTGQSTSMSSNSAITLNQSFLIEGSTTIGTDLGVSTSNRSYAIYDNYGNVIASTTTDGATGTATIDQWLASVNTKMNSYYGTTGVNYAKVENGVVSIDNGYVSGDLVSAIGMTTTSSVSGKLITGTTAQYKEDSKFIGLVSNQVVPDSITRVKDVSSFTAGQTYYLSDASDLNKLAQLVNAGKSTSNVTFVMTNDIDMSSVSNFAMIGNNSTEFRGTFLGNGYEIKNLKINNTSTNFTGLFSNVYGATIKDLGLSNVTINNENSSTSVGALIGKADDSTIENCYVSGGSINFSMDVKTTSSVGGLVGWSYGSSINNCFSSIDINVGGKSDTEVTTGGLVGYSFISLSISNSYSLGNITQSTQGDIGGFVGLTAEDSINNCYSMGNVKSTSTSNNTIGGFVGDAQGTITTNAYATGKVETAYEGNTATIGGFVGDLLDGTLTNCVYNRDSGTVNNGAGYANQCGAIGYSLAQINASGNGLPKLTGNNPYIYREVQTSTTLSQLGLSTASDRTISVNIDGTNHTQSFGANSTVQDVLDYLNGLTGVSATFEESQLRIAANTSQNLTVGGKLATTLLGTISESSIYETHNTSDKLYYSQSGAAMSEATRVGDLLGTNEGGTLNLLVQNVAQITLSYSANSTIGDVLLELASYGINASVSSSGVFTATSSNQVTLSGDVGRALLGSSGTTTYADNKYSSGQLSVMNQLGVTGGVTLDAFGVSSGNIQITDKDGNLVTNFDVDNTKTLSQLASALSAYGFTLTIDSTNKKISVSSTNGNRLADGTSNLVTQFKLDTWTDTTEKLTGSTTLAQMGFSSGATMSAILDGTTTMNMSFGANNTIDDVITALGSFGIDASIVTGTTGNTFSATSNSHSFVFTGELGSALLDGTTGYQNKEIGYESKNPLTYNSATDILKATTTVSDLLGTKEGGTLRLTLDGNVINLNYGADDTVQDITDDLANLGIDVTISSTGVFSAASSDKTFVFSGDIGRALQGGAPTYTQLGKEYQSGDLSYTTTSNITNNSILKDIGINSGSIFVLDRNGNVLHTIDIDENMTINQTKAALKSYGIDMSLTGGKVTISSNDGYSLTDGSSNMISKFKLPAFTQTTAKLSSGTTLAQMGFKDGADLNLLLDGTTPTTISFGATDTMQDIMNSLQALGINCSINATNGAFTATSTEHSFVFSGDLGKFLTTGTAGYVNTDKGYITDPLMVDVPVVTNTSKNLTYSHALKATDTLESMGFADGGVVRLILDGTTPYSFSFLATDTMQDIIDTLATYGIDSTIDADGKISFKNNDHSFTLGGELGSYLTSGGTYTNKTTGYVSSPLSFKTTEKVSEDTKLSAMGVASGALNIIKDGEVAATIQIDEDTTVNQLFSAIKPYGMIGSIIDDSGNKCIQIYSEGDTYLADGTCDAVTKLGLSKIDKGDYDGHVEYWKAGATSGLLTEDMLLTSLDKNGKTAVGSLIFELGTGDDKTQHIVNISATDTIKSFLDKMEAEGVHAVLDNGVIKLDNSVDGITFTGGSSGIRDTLGLATSTIDVYATSSRALNYQEDVTYSVANYADKDTLLSTVNVTNGKMSIFVDGIKTEVTVNDTDKFSDIFSRITSAVAAKTGVTVRAGFVDTDGNIVTNPADKNTGIIGIEVVGDHNLVVGASNDTTNFATIANLKQQTAERVAGSRALYKVNGNSLITGAGLFKDGDITAGTFTIGDATFTIDNTTTLNSLINQINKSDKSYASAYWDTLSGTLVVQSTLSGESLINIESGTSNFTKIMGFTESVAGKETLVTDRQTLGQNAIVKINGTTVTSTSNTITSDISKIKGLTLNLKGVSAGETVTVTVEQDDEGIYNAVNDIVDSYNTLMEGLEKELGDGGSFEHDTMFSMMKNQLKRLMTQTVGGTTIYRNLAAVGISTGEAKDSISTDVTKLLIDKDKFMQALDKDSDAVKQLLVGTTTNPGVFLKVNQIVDSTLKTTGYIASTENSINKNIKKMNTKITDLTAALNKYREQLQTKFSSMERAISNMQNSYSSFLKG